MRAIPTSLALLSVLTSVGNAQARQSLHAGWLIQSAATVGGDGARISTADYQPQGWTRATVPSTVMGALVQAGVYRDPFTGMNMRSLPGMSYRIGANFALTPMAPGSPFATGWWYRTTFTSPMRQLGQRVTLGFDGINYRANVWLNGRLLADSSRVVGTFRRFEFDVTDALSARGPNVLAVELFAPRPADLQHTWVDWNPSPPDKGLGLWQPVWLGTSGDVVVRYPVVSSVVDTATLKRADLTIAAALRNLSPHPVTGVLRGRIGTLRFSRHVALGAGDSVLARFTPDSFPQLRIASPRLWWPAELGSPSLQDLSLEFVADGRVSDRVQVAFGIRQITADTTPAGDRLFRINGRRLLIRGAGWAPDLFLRPEPQRQDDQLAYALAMRLNTLRLEGNYEGDRFWHRADSLGILVMPGWVCCSAWEEWAKWGAEQHQVASASVRDQIRRLRAHPSALVWLNSSDGPPPPDVEQAYLQIERAEAWPNPVISSASAKPARFSGRSGVKMTGPYDWVPPSYWLQDHRNGGAWGFNTETSPGAAVPPIETIRRMLPAESVRWPLDSVWLYHAAGGQFARLLGRFDTALARRYGPPKDLADYAFRSQLMTYEGERAMFEAYRRNTYRSTGIIQWMFNNAWPSIYWHLFDWYLRPGGGYFGTRIANEPIHPMFSYDDRSIVVVNSTDTRVPGARLQVRTLGIDGTLLAARDTVVALPADSSLRILTLPEPGGVEGAYFVSLQLQDAQARSLGRNFYWLSTTPDVLADTSTWYTTPVTAYADYTALQRMPQAHVTAAVRYHVVGERTRAVVTLSNPGKSVAFFLRLQLVGKDGEEALPVLWEDNYLSLLPGERRTVSATVRTRDLRGADPRIVLDGWNSERMVVN